MSYPPPAPAKASMPVSFTAELPAGCKPISDTVGLVAGKVVLPLPTSPLSKDGKPQLDIKDLDLEALKQQQLDKLKEAAVARSANGVVEAGFVLEIRAEGVAVLTVDAL
ncbi:hypothetical protein JCM10207_003000 [Rhodosporidiobolus poonsookiae]